MNARPVLRRLGAPALAIGAGLAAASGQVPWSLWPLALLGFGLLVWRVGLARSRWGAFGLAWLAGVAHFLVALHWITEPFQVDAERDAWMAPYALVLLAAGLALFWGVAGAVSPGRPARFALALVAAEAARGLVLTGFPWALPGHVWLGSPPEQIAAFLGAGALGLLTLSLAAAPVLAGWRGLGVAGAVLAGVWGLGHWQAGRGVSDPAGTVVRLVQPDAKQHLKWHPDFAREFFFRHLDLTAAPSARRPDLIVWPETAVPFTLEQDFGGLGAIVEAADGVPVALGIQRGEGPRWFNALAVIDADAEGRAEVLALYDKYHLVPFGEYIPGGDLLADWLSIPSFAPKEGYGYSAGPAPAVIALEGLSPFVALICYEAVFPRLVRQAAARADRAPEWMLQVTNDAWFGERSGPFQHLALARLRAIEFGLPMVRIANTGVSAVIDARGRVVAQIGLNEQGFIDAALPAPLAPTPYARLGPWPVVALWLIGLGLALRFRAVDAVWRAG